MPAEARGNDDALADSVERGHGVAVFVQHWLDLIGAYREGDDVDPVVDGLVERREGVSVHASVLPEHLVRGDARARGHADGIAFAVVEQGGVRDGGTGGGGGGVRAVAFGVERRLERLSDRAVLSLVALEKRTWRPTSLLLQYAVALKDGAETQPPRNLAGGAVIDG